MTIEYTWKILELETFPDLENPPHKIITQVYYRLSGEEDGYKGTTFNSEPLNYITATGIPFENLTEEYIIGLIENSLEIRNIPAKESIKDMIRDKVFQVSESLPLPWTVT